MQDYKDFEFDSKLEFKDLPQFVDSVHQNHMHYIPIIDAGIAARPNEGYKAFDAGMKYDTFIKASKDLNEPFIGAVWPDEAVYTDFFNQNGDKFWGEQLDYFHNNLQFDGLWLDMNEASNFCTGTCRQSQRSKKPIKNMLPYIPGGRDLEAKSMALDAAHANGYTQLDTHSLWGTQEVRATHLWFQSKNKRTAIIERSAFAGLGKFGSRWLGDNFSQEKYMGYSVTGVMMHNIIGIPFAGSDICGFIGNTSPELCTRWHNVGAFYPFSRNHYDQASSAQEPYVFKGMEVQGVDVLRSMRRSINLKYNMIKYYYTQLQMVSNEGGAFYRPMFFDFPTDDNAYLDQEYNVMLGEALKLSVNSNNLQMATTAFYFPQGTWCSVVNTTRETASCI